MIWGKVDVNGNAVVTHRDSYLLSDQNMVVRVERPFLGMGLLMSGGLSAFGIGFHDLLYPGELAVIGCSACAILLGSLMTGQLKFLSHHLRGAEQLGVVWGTYGALQNVRGEITSALSRYRAGVSDAPSTYFKKGGNA